MLVEVEIDRVDQLDDVLAAGPDIVLLDNMTPEELRAAVARRNELASNIELEASGGVTLETVRDIAETGVERISVGALTHSARCLDRRPRLAASKQSRSRSQLPPSNCRPMLRSLRPATTFPPRFPRTFLPSAI